MTALAWLVPVALFLGGLGLCGFLWSLRSGQYDDLEGAGWRALDDERPVDAVKSEPPTPVAGQAAGRVTMVQL
jgi:cbb3-type cytochrome oxidase maturation protein